MSLKKYLTLTRAGIIEALQFRLPVILIGNRISQKFYTKKQPQTD